MNRNASFNVFSLLFGAVYMAFFWYSEFYRGAMFRYYPVLGGFYLEAQPPEKAGPGILWYSWLAGALVVSTVVALIVPRRLAERLPDSWVWVTSAALLLAIVVYERRWFY